jgi:DNA-binding response OmpR family regulator
MLIFLLEDDPVHAAHFLRSLSGSDFEVRHFLRPAELLQALETARPALIVLDWMVPQLSGMQVLRRVRELLGRSTAVLVLTCVDGEDAIVQALDGGADDYLVKPVAGPVLRARLAAFMRRTRAAPTPLQALQCGAYQLDYARQAIAVAGTPVRLTAKEFDLAWMLMNNRDRFISKVELVAAPHTIAQHMYTLRKKLRLAEHGMRLLSVYGTGYRLEAADAAELPARGAEAEDEAEASV